MYHVVHVVRLDQYLLKVHLECLQQACYADHDTILSGRILLYNVLVASEHVP
jgi:hypothetical protein